MKNDRPLSEFLESLPQKYSMPAGDLLVYKNGKPVYRYYFGHRNVDLGTKIQGNEFYRVYSISKVATCIAVMTLIEKGLITLNTKLSDILPEYKNMLVTKYKDGNKYFEPAKNAITIKNLLQMTGGFNYDCGYSTITDVKIKTGGKAPNLEVSKAIAKMPLAAEPGTVFIYSLCHDILGFVIEKVSGLKFGEYMKKYIFHPLGMYNTDYKMTEATYKRYARLYYYNSEKGEAQLVDPDQNKWFVFGSEYESGGAGLITTVEDYINIAVMLTNMGIGKNGVQILKPETVDIMRKTALPDEMLKDYSLLPYGYSYGLGVRTHTDTENKSYLSGKYEFGWDGAASSYVSADPEKGIAYFLGATLINNIHSREFEAELNRLIYTAFGED